MNVPDNYSAYLAYERSRSHDESLYEKITDAESTVSDVIGVLEDCEPTEEISRAIRELNRLLEKL